MKKNLKKYGQNFLSLMVCTIIMGLPMLAGAAAFQSGLKGLTGNMSAAAGELGTGRMDLLVMIANIISLVLGVLGVILILWIVWAGFIWMTSNGEKEKVTKAKEMIKNAVIGLLIVFASYAIAAFVIAQLSAAAGTPVA